MKLRIFTDGACSGNPGPGGWAALFALEERNEVISGHDTATTNNRMELLAVLEGLKTMKEKFPCYDIIEVHSDSAYVVNALTKGWLATWKSNRWKTSTRDDVKNSDLWQELDKLLIQLRKMYNITFVKVKGHDGVLLNEIVDVRARSESLIAKRESEGK
jgi:ribonuclease HI